MIILRNIKLKWDHQKKDLDQKIDEWTGVKNTVYQIHKRSMDCRKGIFYIYQVVVDLPLTKKLKQRLKNNVDEYQSPFLEIDVKNAAAKRAVIVGAGPAGLFCAYFLARNGVAVDVIERGKAVDDRAKDVEKLLSEGILNPESNVQFGEGGAGTFSDGKLTSRSKSPRIYEVLKTFVDHGADEDILYTNKPHIGTDVLREIIKKMRQTILHAGGNFHFSTKFIDFESKNGKIRSFQTTNGDFSGTEYVLALGNSARDTFEILSKKVRMENKDFAVGFRIEHPQKMIDEVQYGGITDNRLPPSSYMLTDPSGTHGVYTFCMCPGGYVIAASSEENRLCVNGMSYQKRDGKNANAAIIATIDSTIYGKKLLDSMRFQRLIEEKAYQLGGGNYHAPIQTVKDFLENRKTILLGKVEPTYRPGYRMTDLNEIYPESINRDIKKAIGNMERRLKGFSREDAILTGVETRTSSPVRLLREKDATAVDYNNLYVIGEGAGYAGGIVSSAIDGIRAAIEILEK